MWPPLYVFGFVATLSPLNEKKKSGNVSISGFSEQFHFCRLRIFGPPKARVPRAIQLFWSVLGDFASSDAQISDGAPA
jgi:hypothetical protein